MPSFVTCSRGLLRNLVGLSLLLSWCSALAAPTILSTAPSNMESGVSPSRSVSFTFSEPMNPVLTTVQFMDAATAQFLPATPGWNVGNTVLTCTPTDPWPANHTIVWMAAGSNPAGTPLGDPTLGMFMTAAASTGCDPIATLASFTVSKGWLYQQTSSSAPTLHPDSPYCFLGCMTLPCPRSATNVSLRVPSGPTLNLASTPLPGHLTLPDCSYNNLTAYEAAYPYGNYLFSIQSTASNQQVTISFPATLTQPPAPRLSNYLAAQTIDPAQPFGLSWYPLAGGSAADCIYVEVYGGVFATPGPGAAGALNGTATGVVIPAGIFQPNQSYSGCVTFYHLQLATNGSSHISLAYRASTTEFSLRTGSGQLPPPVITNAVCTSGGAFSFEIPCSPGQSFVIESSATLLPDSWQPLCSTNSLSSRVRIVDPHPATQQRLFYRARRGP